jgi:tetratricopeptide (TPR) repeat protein
MYGLARLILFTALLAAASVAAKGAETDRRADVYERFRQAFATEDYKTALPLAEELTRLLEQADPFDSQLPTAYNNLGVVQFRSGDVAAAERSFVHALELLEANQGIASRKLISPLAGLGAVYAAQGQHARAAEVLQRALGISRRANGLFNIDQLDILDALIRSYEALGAQEDLDREQRYALQVVQQEYGYDDPRTLPTITRAAIWYEQTGRFEAARSLWIHSVRVASRESGGRNAATIAGLLGVARTFRLQYVQDPESLINADIPVDPFTGRADPLAISQQRAGKLKLDRDGKAAVLEALEILDSTDSPPRTPLINTLMELGDWYITSHEPDKAVAYYQRAWPLLVEAAAEGEPNPLLEPRPLFYRPPAAASRSLTRTDGPLVSKPIEFSMTIMATGQTVGVTPVTDAPEGQISQIRRALDRAWFSPRFEDGQPVTTEDFRFVEYWFELMSEQPTPGPPAEGDDSDASTAG